MDSVEAAFRHEYGRVVSSLIKTTRDWELAEDCTQEAIARAVEVWPRDGVPDNPGAWLTTVARRQALERLRRDAVGSTKLRQAALYDQMVGPTSSTDDRLDLLFTCCHPVLPPESQIALTLRTLAGLSTAQIARAFLVTEATMSRRLIRAKQKLREAGIPFCVPGPDALDERLNAVLVVLYLTFNQGYGDGAQLRVEAMELASMLDELMPGEPEILGLRALMLLLEARVASRVAADGTLVPLEDQNRSLWDKALIVQGVATLDRALAHRRAGPYQIQAAIAACHATAPRFADTDWTQIRDLYDVLARLTGSPVVELNRAVAVAMADDAATALDMLASVSEPLANYYLLPATRGDLLRRLSRRDEAREAYQQAASLAPSDSERRYLLRRLAEMS